MLGSAGPGYDQQVMSKRSVDYEQGLIEALADPVEAAAYLEAALEDGAWDVLLLALNDVAAAHGLLLRSPGQ